MLFICPAGEHRKRCAEVSLDDLWESMQEQNSKYTSLVVNTQYLRFDAWQDAVIEKWNDRTKVGVFAKKKFKAINQVPAIVSLSVNKCRVL